VNNLFAPPKQSHSLNFLRISKTSAETQGFGGRTVITFDRTGACLSSRKKGQSCTAAEAYQGYLMVW
jgi:hypothetical protein